MKPHDYHVLITHTLPVTIKNILPPNVRQIVAELCDFCNIISHKVIDPNVLDDLQPDMVRLHAI